MNVHATVLMNAPSPLAGEDSASASFNHAWVRGCLPKHAVSREPLTRRRGVYHGAALCADPLATPPSSTRGEGKNAALRVST